MTIGILYDSLMPSIYIYIEESGVDLEQNPEVHHSPRNSTSKASAKILPK